MNRFTFIDLFAGIGGFHLAMHELGGRCVYASESDKYARLTYRENFYDISPKLFDDGMFRGDITKTENKRCVPTDADVLCAGFPCQPFSKMGKKLGFNDPRGTLFFDIAKIIQDKRPKAFFLENVPFLKNHDKGITFDTIKDKLTKDLGYSFFYKVIQAHEYGLPTIRGRLFMVGFRNDLNIMEFDFPKSVPLLYDMSDIFHGKCSRRLGLSIRVGGRNSGINNHRNWDMYLVDGVEHQINLDEAKKMMGFPDDFIFPVSNTQAFKQLGNTVAVNPIKMVAVNIIKKVQANEQIP